MAEKRANFVSVSALDKRPPSKRELLRGLVRQAPFVAKNFQLYFRNAWRRRILRTKVVAPYAVTFYVTHKDRKSTRLNSSHSQISYAVFCLKKKKPQSV